MRTLQIPHTLSIAQLKEGYRSRQFTPPQIAREIVRRAEQDGGMNIWITPPSMDAMQPYLDRLASMNPDEAPLWGVPFAVKDNIDVAGMMTTAGCAEYAYMPDDHAAVVDRLIRAGAIPAGKTNLDQFATGLVGTRSPFGETHNALRPELISGGSSSGSAVAAARGQAAFALGTDTAGSGRVPAALNGLVGYKPSLGAWPTSGVVPACKSLDCVTVFAHSLEDALAVDAALRGAAAADPWSRSLPKPVPGRPARLCLPKEPPGFYGPYADAYRSAWERAVERLERLGLPVEYIDTAVFSQAAAILYEGPWVAERWADLGGFIEANPGTAFPVTEQILRSGAAAQYDAASVFQAMHQLQAYKHEARRLLEDAVLVMPTAGGTWTREQVRQEPVAANRDMGRYTNHCNLLDLCAVAIPAGEAEAQTPFGITMFALAENEGLICGAAQAFGGSAGEDRAARESAASSLSSVCSAEGGTAAAYGSPAAVSAGQETSPFTVCATSVAPPVDQGSWPSAVCALSAGASASQELSSEAHRGEPAALGQPDTSVTAASQADEPAKPETTLVAVCGLHMRGFPLEKQMLGCGAVFVKETESAPKYKLVKLATVPAKPGMIKLTSGGAAVQLELWEMPLASFGAFAASIPSPLGIGKVELADGTEVPGFVCEAYAAAQSEDITSYGGWRQAVSVSNV